MKTKSILLTVLLLATFLQANCQGSLWINDPDIPWNWQTGRISSASLSVHPRGLYLEYGLYLTLSAGGTYFDESRQLEAVMDFQLPAGAMVIDNWLWVGPDIIQGLLIDRWSASDIYEGIVDRKRDPSVLFKNGDTQYQLRVYPMKKNETRKVKITYLMPVTWLSNKVEAALPVSVLQTSAQYPDLDLMIWEEQDFTHPALNGDVSFEVRVDSTFGRYQYAHVPADKLWNNPTLTLNAPVSNGIYLSVYTDEDENFYQMALTPGALINREDQAKIIILIDYEAGNSTVTKSTLVAGIKQRLLDTYGPADSFTLIYSKLHVEEVFSNWMPITRENLDLAFDRIISESIYSNLPGLFSTAVEFLNRNGSEGSVLLVSNSDNFGNYEQANALIKDLKKMRDPLPPVCVADIQDQLLHYYYIGNRYYSGQEYLYVNLTKASGGYYRNIRQGSAFPVLLSEVVQSIGGMVTAFDLYTAPADGFCYGRFGTEDADGFPISRTLTQIGKFYGNTPFLIYLTGLYQTKPFSQLVRIENDEILQADSMLAKMWHGRYIANLEKADNNNMIVQEILYESLSHRVLSRYSAFLCLEPSDSVSVCHSCKDESELVGIDNETPLDSTGMVRLYPNPFTDRLTIEVEMERNLDTDRVEIKIFNLSGQLVHEESVTALPGQVVKAVWAGTGPQGEPAPAGQYAVMVRAGQFVSSKTIMKTE